MCIDHIRHIDELGILAEESNGGDGYKHDTKATEYKDERDFSSKMGIFAAIYSHMPYSFRSCLCFSRLHEYHLVRSVPS